MVGVGGRKWDGKRSCNYILIKRKRYKNQVGEDWGETVFWMRQGCCIYKHKFMNLCCIHMVDCTRPVQDEAIHQSGVEGRWAQKLLSPSWRAADS